MEKKITLLVAALMIATMSFADTYKVLFVNSGAIKINGRIATVGLVFSDKDKIAWSDEQQAMKVINLTTKRVVVLAAKALKKKSAASIYDYLTSKKHLSTRNFNREKPLEEWQIDSTLYMVDTIFISQPQNGSRTVEPKLRDESGNIMALPITKDSKSYIITKDIYRGKSPRRKYLDILEQDKDLNWEYVVYSRIIIEPVSKTLN